MEHNLTKEDSDEFFDYYQLLKNLLQYTTQKKDVPLERFEILDPISEQYYTILTKYFYNSYICDTGIREITNFLSFSEKLESWLKNPKEIIQSRYY